MVRLVNEGARGRGIRLRDVNGRRWKIKQVLLYADYTLLVAETREHLKHIVNEFERS